MYCKEENIYPFKELATGLRPYKCELCRKRFDTEEEAKAHLKQKAPTTPTKEGIILIRRTFV